MKDKPANPDFLLILDITKTDPELRIKVCMLIKITPHPTPAVTSFVCCCSKLDVEVNLLFLSVSAKSKNHENSHVK